MSVAYEDIITSPFFEFLVGDERKLCVIHESLVAKCSQPLRTLMADSMEEASNRCATLSTVNAQTFIRFSQYAYTGDYTAPPPNVLLPSSDIGTTNCSQTTKKEEYVDDGQSNTPLSVSQPRTQTSSPTKLTKNKIPKRIDEWKNLVREWDSGRGRSSQDSQKIAKAIVDSGFSNEQLKSALSLQIKTGKQFRTACDQSMGHVCTLPSSQPPYRNKDACEEMIEVFLAHARTYVFADMYDIQGLKKLASCKLRQSLAAFQLFPERVADVVALIRYCFANTQEDDVLRKVVIEYSACMAEHLMADPEFRTLTKDNASFSSDLLRAVMRRLE